MDAYVLRYSTDTAHPQDIVPIYHIHSITQPFCRVPTCWCHANQAKIAPLLAAMKRSELILAEGASFREGKG